MTSAGISNAVDEPVYLPSELARIKKLHPSTIRKLFQDEPGVQRLGHAAKGRRRQYYSLRIPLSVADRVFKRMTVGGGSAA
jgi:hypothetical protein